MVKKIKNRDIHSVGFKSYYAQEMSISDGVDYFTMRNIDGKKEIDSSLKTEKEQIEFLRKMGVAVPETSIIDSNKVKCLKSGKK